MHSAGIYFSFQDMAIAINATLFAKMAFLADFEEQYQGKHLAYRCETLTIEVVTYYAVMYRIIIPKIHKKIIIAGMNS